jgi:hypothetical protein
VYVAEKASQTGAGVKAAAVGVWVGSPHLTLTDSVPQAVKNRQVKQKNRDIRFMLLSPQKYVYLSKL